MAWDWGNAGSGAASGAAAGSAFGPWGSAIGGVGGGILGGLTGGGDPSKKARKYLDQIPGELRKYLQPYIDSGMISEDNLRDLSGEYQKLYEDPNAIISRLGAGYQQSPGYQWRLNQGENAINNAAASGGMAGTGQHQQQAGELASNLANQDYQQYLAQALGLYGTGLAGKRGIEEGFYNTGVGASGSLAAGIANVLQQQADLSYKGGANKNQSNSDMWSNILSMFKGNNGGWGGSGGGVNRISQDANGAITRY